MRRFVEHFSSWQLPSFAWFVAYLINISSQANHKSDRKVDFNEFVQNSLGCDMGMITFDLRGYGDC